MLLHIRAYLRSAVLNGCRSAARRAGRAVPPVFVTVEHAPSAESALLDGQVRGTVLAALRGLPVRQREALVLRFYLDLPEPEIARVMGIRPGTVRSATHRALKALGQLLESTP